jgi:hypothetical protein
MPPPSRLEIEGMIREFQRRFLAPDAVPQLKIERGVDCIDRYTEESPASLEKCGVYMIFDESDSLIYIGETEKYLYKRIPVSLKFVKKFRNHPHLHPLRQSPRASRCVDIVPFDWNIAFLVPALESYLIDEVSQIEGNVLINVRGKRGPVRKARAFSRRSRGLTMDDI